MSAVPRWSEPLLPLTRAIRRRGWYQLARVRSRLPVVLTSTPPPVTFVIGCGRSGTTVTGEVLGWHPQTRYLFEPYHLWAAVDTRTDVTGVYTSGEAHCLLDQNSWSPEIQRRFDRLFGRWEVHRRHQLLVEKNPINSMRIGYLRRLSPGCRFIHLVRDGRDVVRSIEQLSIFGEYRIAGLHPYNLWWGVADKKWSTLASDLLTRQYFSGDLTFLRDDRARAACEWIVSLEEVDRWRPVLADDLLDVRYEELTRDPDHELRRIAAFLRVEPTQAWLDRACQHIQPSTPQCPTLDLPAEIERPFQKWRVRLGYDRPDQHDPPTC